MIIFGSAGPVISTRRSSRSGGGLGDAPARIRAGSRRCSAGARARRRRRSPPGARSAARAGPPGRARTIDGGAPRKSSASGVRIASEPATRGPAIGRPRAGAAPLRPQPSARRTVASIRPCGSVVETNTSPGLSRPNGARSTCQWCRFGQDHAHPLDRWLGVHHRRGHDPDRCLDRRAEVLGERLQQGGPGTLPGGIEVERVAAGDGRAVAPRGSDLRRHQPVVDLGQRRVPIAIEARERRLGRLHHRQVVDAGLDLGGAVAVDRHAGEPGQLAGSRRTRPGASPPSSRRSARQACSTMSRIARSTDRRSPRSAAPARAPKASGEPVSRSRANA